MVYVRFLLPTVLVLFVSLTALAEKQACVVLEEGVSNDWILSRLQNDKELSESEKLLRQSVQNSGLRGAALNRDLLAKHNENFTVILPEGSPTDQVRSGRCWIFADLNAIRSTLIADGRVTEKFEFSQTYLHFFNMLEKSAKFLDLEAQDVAQYKSGGVLKKRLLGRKKDFGDGGWHEFFAYLVSRYGLIPKGAMKETVSSENTAALLDDLEKHLMASSQEMQNLARQMRKEGIDPASSAGQQRLSVFKTSKMNGAWNIIATHLGTPPTEFEWRFQKAPVFGGGKMVIETQIQKFSPGGTFNADSDLPSFSEDFVQYDPRDYVSVVNNPFEKRGEVFEVKDSAISAAKGADPQFDIRYINLDSEQMQDLVMKSIDGGQPVWFAADVMKDFDAVSGVLHPDILKHDGVYGHKPDEAASPMSRQDQIRLQLTSPTHAMSLIGYDRPDPDLPPIKFLDENSWGPRTNTMGKQIAPTGNLSLYRQWFDKYVFVVMIHKKFLSPQDLQKWSQPAKMLTSDLIFRD